MRRNKNFNYKSHFRSSTIFVPATYYCAVDFITHRFLSRWPFDLSSASSAWKDLFSLLRRKWAVVVCYVRDQRRQPESQTRRKNKEEWGKSPAARKSPAQWPIYDRVRFKQLGSALCSQRGKILTEKTPREREEEELLNFHVDPREVACLVIETYPLEFPSWSYQFWWALLFIWCSASIRGVFRKLSSPKARLPIRVVGLWVDPQCNNYIREKNIINDFIVTMRTRRISIKS